MRLVIGTGNLLRGDDSVGQSVARAVAEAGWPGVVAIAETQLAPEHAAIIAQAEVVVFVDADLGAGDSVRVLALDAAAPGNASPSSHRTDPAGLMWLALHVYGARPPAWLVGIPCEQFELPDVWSARAAGGAVQAYDAVRRLTMGADAVSAEGAQ